MMISYVCVYKVLYIRHFFSSFSLVPFFGPTKVRGFSRKRNGGFRLLRRWLKEKRVEYLFDYVVLSSFCGIFEYGLRGK